MKHISIQSIVSVLRPHRVVTRFGQAVLVRCSRSKFILRGGSRADHIEARE